MFYTNPATGKNHRNNIKAGFKVDVFCKDIGIGRPDHESLFFFSNEDLWFPEVKCASGLHFYHPYDVASFFQGS